VRRLVSFGALIGGLAFGACSSFQDAPTAEGDGGTDGAVDGGGTDPYVAFCKADGGALCEDFDDPGSDVLPEAQLDDAGTLAVVDDPHASPPKALRVAIPRPADVNCHEVKRTTRDTTSIPAPNGFSAEYKTHVAAAFANPGSVNFGAIVTYQHEADDDKNCDVYLRNEDGVYALIVTPHGYSDPPSQHIELARNLLIGQWSTVFFDVHGPPGAHEVSVFVDGQDAVATGQSTTLDALCQDTIRVVSVVIGFDCVSNAVGGDLDVTFDDLRVIAH
jgi:hypothetical protein